VNQTESESL